MHHELRPCSVGIGLGSRDLGVADTTVALYLSGMMPLIVFTGATSRTTQGRMPRGEAEHYRDRALELDVPADVILVEPQARNTGQNITLSRALLEERKLWPEVEFVDSIQGTRLVIDMLVGSLQRLLIEVAEDVIHAYERLASRRLQFSETNRGLVQRGAHGKN